MKILAIDPGSFLGWATNQTGRLEWGTEDFHVKNGESSGNRWRRFGQWLIEISIVPFKHREHWPGEVKVDLIVYERAIFAPKARAAAEIAAGFTTRLEEHCERHGIALQPVAVSTLKKFATGKGNADKEAMRLTAGARLHRYFSASDIDVARLTGDEADALFLYWYAENEYSTTRKEAS